MNSLHSDHNVYGAYCFENWGKCHSGHAVYVLYVGLDFHSSSYTKCLHDSYCNSGRRQVDRITILGCITPSPKKVPPHSHSCNCSVTTSEHHWTSPSVLETTVRNRLPPPTSLEQLQVVLQEEWHKIDVIQDLYGSIPRRADVVLKANGGPTPY
jgi:hypothetical protein